MWCAIGNQSHYRIDDVPGGKHLVTPHEQRLVAARRVHQKPLIGVRKARFKRVIEAEIEFRGEQPHPARARFLGDQLKAQPFAWLQPDDQPVGRAVDGAAAIALEDVVWALLEGDDNFRGAPRKLLAGADIERNAGPAPVVDRQLHRDKGLGIRGLAELLCVFLILAALDVGGGKGPDGPKHTKLLVADLVSVEEGGRFHRNKADKLQKVVLHHVADGAISVVVTGPAIYADGLGDGDLHMIYMVVVPQGLEDHIGETQRHQVLHRFLAEIMIDPVDLRFIEDLGKLCIDGAAGCAVMAKRFFHHKTGLRGDKTVCLEKAGGVTKQAWRDGKVENGRAGGIAAFGDKGGKVVSALS